MTILLNNFKNQYWLKTELMAFCKKEGLSTIGSKEALLQRIEIFLKTGHKIKPASNKTINYRDSDQAIRLVTFVVNYKNDAQTRQFFVKHIGKHFRFNGYLRQFTHKDNISTGLTYGDLVKGWQLAEAKHQSSEHKNDIGRQFEYNQFTRDFFFHEKGKSRQEMIQAWHFLKTLPGEKTYTHYKAMLLEKDGKDIRLSILG